MTHPTASNSTSPCPNDAGGEGSVACGAGRAPALTAALLLAALLLVAQLLAATPVTAADPAASTAPGILLEEVTTSERAAVRLTPLRTRPGPTGPAISPGSPVANSATGQGSVQDAGTGAAAAPAPSPQVTPQVSPQVSSMMPPMEPAIPPGMPGVSRAASPVDALPADAPSQAAQAMPNGTGRFSTDGTASGADADTATADLAAARSVSRSVASLPPAGRLPSENLLDRMDVYALSPDAAKLALPRMVPPVMVEQVRTGRLPMPAWDGIIARASRLSGLEERLIAAVVRAESGFDVGAVSPKGARGPMQIMPATGQELGLADPFDPQANVEAGSRYLRQQLDRFGSLELALAAYNAGPGNVERFQGVPPFAETRAFVSRVLSGLQ